MRLIKSSNALLKAPFPTVSDIESSMEALVDAFARDLETDKVLTRDNGLLAFAAVDDRFPFHRFTSRALLRIPCGTTLPCRTTRS